MSRYRVIESARKSNKELRGNIASYNNDCYKIEKNVISLNDRQKMNVFIVGTL